MTIKEYQLEASRTCQDLGSEELNLTHMRLGMVTEIAEIADIFKKHIAYKKPIDFVNLKEEIGDVCWYIVNMATFEQEDLEIFRKDRIWIPNDDEKWEYELDSFLVGLYYNQDCNSLRLQRIMDLCKQWNIDFEECLDLNIAKLKARFPEKFTEEKALNRNLEIEREILERNAS